MKIRVLIALLAGLALQAGQAQEKKPNTRLEQIIFVFKTHFDIGYTDLAERIVQKYGTSMIGETLSTLEKSNTQPAETRFRWTIPGWPMKEILDQCSPEAKPLIDRAIRDGRFVVHALPFTFETEAGTPEALTRSFRFSSDIARSHGLELPRDAKLTDVPSHSWFLPTLLKNAGVDFLQIGCNAASSSPDIPVLFWWEGPDGSRLMTLYWEAYYGTDIIPAEDWPYKTWIAIIHTNDNVGAPPLEEVERTLAEARRLAPNARLTIGRMSDFHDAIIKENPQLPVIRGDMPDTWIHGYLSMPVEVGVAAKVKSQAITLEILGNQLDIWGGPANDVTRKLSEIYEQSLLFDEHTFGLAMSHGASGYWCYGSEFRRLRSDGIFDKIELSWREKGLHAHQAGILASATLSRKMDELAAAVSTPENRIVVYNPLPWARTGLTVMKHHSGWFPVKALKDAATGKVIPLINEKNLFSFIAEDVPPSGYRTYIPADSGNAPALPAAARVTDAGNLTLENEFVLIRIDRHSGGILSLVNKRTGRDYAGRADGHRPGTYLYERFGKENTDRYAKDYIKGGWDWAPAELGRINLSDDPYRSASGIAPEITVEQNGLTAAVHLSFRPSDGLNHAYSVRYRLESGSPALEVNWAVDGKPADPWPEAGWLCFPLAIDKPVFRLGRTGGISDPAKDFVKGSNFDYCFVQDGLAVLDSDNSGVGFYSPGLPGISLDRPGLWKYSKDFVPNRANVFFNLFNNQWSTNFTEWIEGSWQNSVYIWFIEDYDNEKSLITPALEKRNPLVSMVGTGPGGSLPLAQSGVALTAKGLELTAFGPNPDGGGTLLRFWEKAGNRGKTVIVLPEGSRFKRAEACNLRGVKTGTSLPVRNNRIELDYQPYKPVSLILN